jgi:hypothetical protein
MTPIDDAIADLELTEEGADFALTQITDYHGVNRSTLSKRWRGLTGSQSDGYAQQQLLNPKQENELVRYIENLTAKLLPPTRQMIRNFSSEISCIYVGKAWVLCFLHCYHNMLTTKWSTAMESNCYAADSYNKYKLYFELLYSKMSEYHILPHNTYNMNEKRLHDWCSWPHQMGLLQATLGVKKDDVSSPGRIKRLGNGCGYNLC